MFVIPYKLLTHLCPVVDGKVTIPKKLLDFLLMSLQSQAEFDEDRYLRHNPDVAASIRKGEWATGKQHFAKSGYFEDRGGAGLDVNEVWYGKANADVGRAIKSGDWVSGETHYYTRGMFEWRCPNKETLDDFQFWRDLLLAAKPDAEKVPSTTVERSDSAGPSPATS
jgi:hypothetical protein